MAERPGIMFYFDLEPALKMLSDAEVGQLFKAAMEYGHYGVVPEFDGMVAMAWSFVQPKVDRDGEQYQTRILQQSWKGYISRIKDEAARPSFEEWYETVHKPQLATASNGQPNQPTITTTASTSVTASPSITPNPKTSLSSKTRTTTGGSKGGGALHPMPDDPDADFLKKQKEAIELLDRITKNG